MHWQEVQFDNERSHLGVISLLRNGVQTCRVQVGLLWLRDHESTYCCGSCIPPILSPSCLPSIAPERRDSIKETTLDSGLLPRTSSGSNFTICTWLIRCQCHTQPGLILGQTQSGTTTQVHLIVLSGELAKTLRRATKLHPISHALRLVSQQFA